MLGKSEGTGETSAAGGFMGEESRASVEISFCASVRCALCSCAVHCAAVEWWNPLIYGDMGYG